MSKNNENENEPIETALSLPDEIREKLLRAGKTGVRDVQALVLVYDALKRCSISTLSSADIQVLKKSLESHKSFVQKTGRHSSSSNLMQSDQIELKTLEKDYKHSLNSVSLIGEVPIDEEDCIKIGKLFGNILHRRTQKVALDTIVKNYPATLLFFLTGVGIYHYDEAGYWPAVSNFLGGAQYLKLQNRLKREYQKLLPSFGLPDFIEEREDYKGKTFYYVRLILLHGGIPKTSLGGFFTNVVRPICDNRDLDDLSVADQLEEIRYLSRYYQSTDKPVVQFLDHGGDVAKDFLERSITLYQTYFEDGTILEPDLVGLPAYVVNYFEEWISNRQREKIELRRKTPKPTIKYSPWGVGISLNLPPQQSSIDFETQEGCYWQIDDGVSEHRIDTAISDRGEYTETKATEVLITDPFKELEVRFISPHETTKSHCVPPHDCFFVFSPTTGIMEKRVQAKKQWVVLHKDVSIEVVSGTAIKHETLPDLGDGWNTFLAEAWDFSAARKIDLKREDQLIHSFSLGSQTTADKPYLISDNEFAGNVGEIPLFIGFPPLLVIPFSDSEDDAMRKRWKIEIKSQGLADPLINLLVPLSELPSDAQQTSLDTIQIRLDHHTLLGNRPFGKYRLHVKGPLGRSALFRFQILPAFTITGNENIYLPFQHDEDILNLNVDVGLMAGVQILDSESEIRRTQRNLYALSVNPSQTSIPVRICQDAQNSRSPSIDIDIKIQSLRWTLISNWNILDEWSIAPYRLPKDAFLQQTGSFVIVNLPRNHKKTGELALYLTDLKGNPLQVSKQKYDLEKVESELYRFNFDQFLSTVENSSSPIHSFVLRLKDPSQQDVLWEQPIASIRQALEITDFRVQIREEPDEYRLVFQWQEVFKLKYRSIAFWPQWRPWEPAVLFEIPDETEQEFTLKLCKDDLIPGEYLVQMVIFDPWVDNESSLPRPNFDDPACDEILVSTPVARAKYLYAQMQNNDDYQSHLELLILLDLLHDSRLAEEQFRWCCDHLAEAKGNLYLAVTAFVTESENQLWIDALRAAATTPNVVQHLIDEKQKRAITTAQVKRIIQPLLKIDAYSQEVLLLLLQSSIHELEFLALRKLLASDLELVFDHLIAFHKLGKLSWINTIELLQPFQEAVETILQKTEAKDEVTARLDRFFKQEEKIYGVGDWLISGPNYGYIEKAVNIHTQQELKKFIKNDPEIRLNVMLHLETGYEEYTVFSPSDGQLTFTSRKNKITYQCLDCNYLTQSKFGSKNHYLETGHEMIATGQKTFPLDSFTIEKKHIGE